jgi:hypothetical protein
MDLHNFDGKTLSVWMFQLQQCFIYYNTPNDLHKYMFVSYHMEGEALNWLITMERGGVFTMDADWENFVRLIHLRFGQELEEQKCDAIDKLEEDFGEEIKEATKEQIQTTVMEENLENCKTVPEEEYLENFKNAVEEKRDDAKHTLIQEIKLVEDTKYKTISEPDTAEDFRHDNFNNKSETSFTEKFRISRGGRSHFSDSASN